MQYVLNEASGPVPLVLGFEDVPFERKLRPHSRDASWRDAHANRGKVGGEKRTLERRISPWFRLYEAAYKERRGARVGMEDAESDSVPQKARTRFPSIRKMMDPDKSLL